MSSQKLKVTVVAAKEVELIAPKKALLLGKNAGNKSSPYCEVTIFNEKGDKSAAPQTTTVVKDNLHPTWNQLLTFLLDAEPKETFTLTLRCFDKHVFRKDKFLGQVTVTFNSKLVSSTEAIDHWFPLTARNASEAVSGSVHLKIQYGDLKSSATGLETKSTVAAQLGLNIGTPAAVAANTSFSNNNNNATSTTTSPTKVPVPEPEALTIPPDEVRGPDLRKTKEVVEDLMGSGEPFIVHGVQADPMAFEKIRDGPPTSSLVKINNAQVTLSNKNLTAAHSSSNYSLQGLKCDTIVTSGKWYYEVDVTTNGQIQIGWCDQAYDPNDQSKGDCWLYDGNRQQKMRNGNGVAWPAGQKWYPGDVIGVLLDHTSHSLKFTKNGVDMGEAFGISELGSKAKSLSPCVVLSRNMKVNVNFGATPFKHPQHGYNPLHQFLDDKEMATLADVYAKYCKISNAAAAEQGEDFDDAIFDAGLDAYVKNCLGITDEYDPGLFIVAWKLGCVRPWAITKSEWMNGWPLFGAAKEADMKKKLSEWKKDLQDDRAFTVFYNWVMDYLREDKRILDFEQAKIVWQILFNQRKWPLFDKWIEFLASQDTKAVNQDLWNMLWEFMKAFPKDVKGYDPMESAWPIKIDEFIEWLENKDQ